MNPWMRRFYNLMLFAYPRDFREEYRASLSDHFESERPDWASIFRTFADVLASAVSMRAENLWRDVVYAMRMNVKAPLFTIAVLCAIALSIATNTVVFALLDAVLLEPLPFAQAQQLGLLWQRSEHAANLTFTSLGTDQVAAIARASRTFASVTASLGTDTVSLQGHGGKRIEVMNNYFSTLGVRPELGRFFSGSSSEHDAVISDALWREQYAGDATVLGKSMRIGQTTYRILGVAPAAMLNPTFGTLMTADVWTPVPRVQQPGAQLVAFPIVRLRSGVTWRTAQADLARVARNLKGDGAALPGSAYYVAPLSDSVLGAARAFLWMVFAAVTGVLLVACANVANLLLVRAAMRQNEFATRNAVGASRRRIASQVFIEAFLLAAAGAAIGLAVAWAALPWAKTSIPGDFPRLQSAHIDWPVLLYVCVLLIAVTLLTGMIPAYNPRPKRVKDGAAKLRAALIVVEVAVAFALATGFGLMLHSFVSLTSADLGFAPRDLYAAMIAPNRTGWISPTLTSSHPERAQAILERLRSIPGVQDASIASMVPFQNALTMTYRLPPGWNGKAHGAPASVNVDQTSASYFRVMRIPLIAGRSFRSRDFAANGSNVIVNRAFVRSYFPNENVVGKNLRLSPKDVWRIVGVVGDTRSSLKQTPQALVYLPYNGGFGPYYGFAIRTGGRVSGLASQIAAVLRRSDSAGGTINVSSLQDLIAKDAAGTAAGLELLGALAAVAVLLGICGVYSVVAYGTERRFHEIGIRMAVGAAPRDVVALVVRGALAEALVGVAAGVVLCAFTTHLLQAQLYATSALDPATLFAVAAAMLVCTAFAALIPACRAAFTRPAFTLRYE